MHIGVLDNDACALEYITALVKRTCTTLGLDAAVTATTFPTAMVRACCDPGHPMNMLLLDMSLTGASGIDLAWQLRPRSPGMLIAGMTAYDVSMYRAHVSDGTLDTLLDKSMLRDTLPQLLADMRHQPTDVQDSTHDLPAFVSDKERRLSVLSRKELEVVMMSAARVGNRQIAHRLGIEEATVFSYHRNIKQKLGLDSWYDVLDLYRS